MKTWIISAKVLVMFIILTGIVYPLIITGIAKTAFPFQASGSLIFKNNKLIGSKLIGQNFDTEKYFSSRPSAVAYNPLPSGASNFGLTNKKLIDQVTERKYHFIEFNDLDSLTRVPSEILFASASGLDPHISVNAAILQVDRIVKSRNFNNTQRKMVLKTIKELTEPRQLYCLGEERINVLLLNIELDKIR